MKLGYAHPDHWLRTVTSKQVADWMAFAKLEPVGEPVPPDPIDREKQARNAKRANLEGYFHAHKEVK